MIDHFDQIKLQGKPVFTQLQLSPPLEEPLALPSDACFLYITAGEGHTLYQPTRVMATPGTVILSTCGLTVGNMISHQPAGSLGTTIVHLNRDLLDLVFSGEKPELWEELQTPVNRYVVQAAASELVRFYFAGIDQLFRNQAALSETMLKLKLKEIILLLLQTESSEPIRQIVKSLFSERTFTFRELVDAHIFSPVGVDELAMLTNCSTSTFKRRFQETYDATPGKYLVEKRLEKVAESLRTSDELVSNIGYDCGFESPEHLSRAFKKKYGVSPSAYRMNLSIK